jgi:hypothetical protein
LVPYEDIGADRSCGNRSGTSPVRDRAADEGRRSGHCKETDHFGLRHEAEAIFGLVIFSVAPPYAKRRPFSERKQAQ